MSGQQGYVRHCILALLVAIGSLSFAQGSKANKFLRLTPAQNITIEKQLAFGLRYGTSAFSFFEEAETATVESLDQKKHRPWYTTGEFFAVELCNVACIGLGVYSETWVRSSSYTQRELVYVATYTFLSPVIPHLIDEEFSETKGSLLGGAVGACLGSVITAVLFEAGVGNLGLLPFFYMSALVLPPLGTLVGYHIIDGGEK